MALVDSWYINPLGEKLLGNEVLPVPAGSEKAFKALRSDTPTAARNFLESLTSGVDTQHVISPEELQHVLDLHSQGEEVWDLVKDFGGDNQVLVHRYKDRSLFKGAMFGRLTAIFPSLSKEEVVYRVMNNQARVAWDKQVCSFDLYPAPQGNSVLRYRMNAPPFSLRDMVVFQVLLCNDKDKRVMLYQRLADNSLYPPTRKEVRASIPVLATMISDLPTGGTFFRNICVVDPNLPIIPNWVINMFIPMEFKKWTEGLRRECAQKAGAEELKSWYANIFSQSTLSSNAAVIPALAVPIRTAADTADSSSQQPPGSAAKEQVESVLSAETQNSAKSLARARQPAEADNVAKGLLQQEAPAADTVEVAPDQIDSSSHWVCCWSSCRPAG